MPQGNRAPEGHEVPVVGARLHNRTHSALQRDLGEDVVAQVAQHSAGVGQLGAAQVDLVRHHPDKFENLLPAGDKARAQHVVHAEGLKLLAQLQVVQNEPVAVVGNAQTVRGLAIGGGGKVGADPGGQPGASARALGQQRPVQRAQPVPGPACEKVGQGQLIVAALTWSKDAAIHGPLSWTLP